MIVGLCHCPLRRFERVKANACLIGDELDFLCMDPILPNQEGHPFPRDIAHNYTGRLVAKFLLSFTDEKYIFGPY